MEVRPNQRTKFTPARQVITMCQLKKSKNNRRDCVLIIKKKRTKNALYFEKLSIYKTFTNTHFHF